MVRTRYHKLLNPEGRLTRSGSGARPEPGLHTDSSIPASCQRSRTWTRSDWGWTVDEDWTTQTRLMPCCRREFAEGKSCGKTTQRLSNWPGLGARSTFWRSASKRKAGGATAGMFIPGSSAAPLQYPLCDTRQVDYPSLVIDYIKERNWTAASPGQSQPGFDGFPARQIHH